MTTQTSSSLAGAVFAPNEARLTLNDTLYSPNMLVFQAAYVFTDRAYVTLDLDGNGRVVAILRGKTPLDDAALQALAGEFANELIHQSLRLRLSHENQRLRELIAAKALFAAARPEEYDSMQQSFYTAAEGQGEPGAPAAANTRPWDAATPEEQAELDTLLNEIEKEFADDPTAIAVPWDEKQAAPKPPTD